MDLLDVDGCFTLVGKVVKRAILDARRGDRGAKRFLEVVAPDLPAVQEMARPAKRIRPEMLKNVETFKG